MADCPICGGDGWVCDAHPLTKWGTCCGEPGVPCRCNPAEKMPPDVSEVYEIDDEG